MRRRAGKPPTYLFTVDPADGADAAALEGARRAVRAINKGRKRKLRVHTSPRFDRDSPHAWKYDNRFMKGKRRRREDADALDVYVKPR